MKTKTNFQMTSTMNHRLLLVTYAIGLLVTPAVFAETPPKCTGNGSSGQISFLVNSGPQPNVTLHVGDTVFYQVSLSVSPTACNATGVNAFLRTADGVLVQWLSNADIDQGEKVICPGNAKRRHSTLLTYVV